MSFDSFEHEAIKHFKSIYGTIENKDYYVSCSGGLDSVALFHLMSKIKPIFNFNLKILHIHHGSSENGVDLQSVFRDQALNFCKDLAESHNIEIKTFKSTECLKSETECREFRKSVYDQILSQKARVFLAHHKDDLFETLLMRLLRGTNLQGLASPFSDTLERPFLKLAHRGDILKYQKTFKFRYLEDPSNVKTEHFRNWLRHDWLNELKNSPYGLEPFKKSLCQISEQLSEQVGEFQNERQKIDLSLGADKESGKAKGFFKWSDFSGLTLVQKKSMISSLLLETLRTGYTHGQVLEIVKNLERNQNHISFSVAGLSWVKKGDAVTFICH